MQLTLFSRLDLHLNIFEGDLGQIGEEFGHDISDELVLLVFGFQLVGMLEKELV